MNALGVLAVMFICLTVLIIAYWLFTKPITIKHIQSRDETMMEKLVTPPELSEQERRKLEAELNKTTISQKSMDSVIRAANEIMGIASIDDEGGNK